MTESSTRSVDLILIIFQGNKDIFQRVTEAYETLSSKEKRPEYDRELFKDEPEDTETFEMPGPGQKRRKSEPYYTPEYTRAMHNFQRAEARWSARMERVRLFGIGCQLDLDNKTDQSYQQFEIWHPK